MRAILVVMALLGVVGCGEDGAEAMRQKAVAARAAEGPPMRPKGVWSVDVEALGGLRAGGEYFQPAEDAMDIQDVVAPQDPVVGTLTIADDHMFRLDMTIGQEKIDLYGAITLDDQYIEMPVAQRNGAPLAPDQKKMLILGEVEGDQMMLHLLAWRVWVPLARQ